jgi:hypothetical protein
MKREGTAPNERMLSVTRRDPVRCFATTSVGANDFAMAAPRAVPVVPEALAIFHRLRFTVRGYFLLTHSSHASPSAL